MAIRKLKKGDEVRYWMFTRAISNFVRNGIYIVKEVSETLKDGADWHYDIRVEGIKDWHGMECFAFHEAKL